MSADNLFVKICGLREASSARVAVEAGADALGFILAPARRQVTPEAIRAIREELESASGELPPLVGVTVNAGPNAIARDIESSGVDLVQLSGDEDPAILAEIDLPVIRAMRLPSGMAVDAALHAVSAWFDAPRPAAHVIVEGHVAGAYGGTGEQADWALAAEIARRYPVILAGGLDPENVFSAIETVDPFGVDVSSGTETDGVKDHAKIRDFIHHARTARQTAPGSR